MAYQFGHVDPDEHRHHGDEGDPMSEDYYDEAPAQRRRPMTTAVVVAVMVLFAAGLWFAYTQGKHHAGGVGAGDVPLIRADEHATKVKPDQPGGMEVPDRDNPIYAEKPGGLPVQKVVPSSEQPVPRAATASGPFTAGAVPSPEPTVTPPLATTGTTATSPAGKKPLMPPAPELTGKTPAETAPEPAAKSPANNQATVLSPPKPATARLPPAAKATAPVVKASGIRIQIGAMRTDELANKEWERLKRANSDLLGGMSAVAVRADLGDKGIFYRIQAGPVADTAAADKLCGELKKRSIGCIVR